MKAKTLLSCLTALLLAAGPIGLARAQEEPEAPEGKERLDRLQKLRRDLEACKDELEVLLEQQRLLKGRMEVLQARLARIQSRLETLAFEEKDDPKARVLAPDAFLEALHDLAGDDEERRKQASETIANASNLEALASDPEIGAAARIEVLLSASFEKGPEGWETFKSGRGHHAVESLPEGGVQWERTHSRADGGSAGIQKDLGIDVSRFDYLLVGGLMKVENHSLKNSGWSSDRKGGWGEYPASVRIECLDEAEKKFRWAHGFIAAHDGSTRLVNYTRVPRNRWVRFGFDLKSPEALRPRDPARPEGALPPPAILESVRLLGNGWDFAGAVRECVLVGVEARTKAFERTSEAVADQRPDHENGTPDRRFVRPGGYWKPYAKRYAIVVMAGRVKPPAPHYRWYWNDTWRMVQELRKQGFPKRNICYLAYGKNVAEHRGDVAGPSTTSNIRRALREIARKAGPDDLVYLYWIDHGNQRLFNTYDGFIAHAELGNLIRRLKARAFLGAFNPCHSGALVDDVHSGRAVILTSVRATEGNSFGWAGHWRRALQGGKKTSFSDADGDGRVTMAEAYAWVTALANEKGEHPLIDDDGDGKPGDLSAGTFVPGIPGREGYRASRFALDAWFAPVEDESCWIPVQLDPASAEGAKDEGGLQALMNQQAFLDQPRKTRTPALLFGFVAKAKRGRPTAETQRCLAVVRNVLTVPEALSVPCAAGHFACFEADLSSVSEKQNAFLNASRAPVVVVLDGEGAVASVLEGEAIQEEDLFKAMTAVLPEAEREKTDKRIERLRPRIDALRGIRASIEASRKEVLDLREELEGGEEKEIEPRLARAVKTLRAHEAKYAKEAEKLAEAFAAGKDDK